MTRKPFSVRIFLQDGDAHGVKIVSRSKWSGRGLVIPRACLADELGRAELMDPGIFLLSGAAAAAHRQILYIGAADPVCTGLARFIAGDQYWSTAIIFTCKENSLNPAQCQMIALRLLQLARTADKAEIIAAGPCEQPSLSARESSVAENFLDHMLGLYPLFEVTALES